MLDAKGKAVLVTGCDSGFGLILAKVVFRRFLKLLTLKFE